MLRILTTIECYLPGTRGGGPVRALSNLVKHFQGRHHFEILTRNHDYLDPRPFPGLLPNQWMELEPGVQVCYAEEPSFIHLLRERAVSPPLSPDWLYLHGAFAPMTRRVLRARRKDPDLAEIPVLLAPHGNFGPGTMRHHWLRKQAWLLMARAMGYYRDVHWHAGSEREADQIRMHIASAKDIRVVPMAPEPVIGADQRETIDREPANLRLVYFGRLSPEKNLRWALEMLDRWSRAHPQWRIHYNLLGAGDPAYEQRLRRAALRLSGSIEVRFLGVLPPDELRRHLFTTQYDALLMPSLTENFSYAVLESLQAGIPVLVSDQTPWRGLKQHGVGWDLPLDGTGEWLAALEALANETGAERGERMERTATYVRNWLAAYPGKAEALFGGSREPLGR